MTVNDSNLPAGITDPGIARYPMNDEELAAMEERETVAPLPSTARIPPLSQSRYELMACPHLYVERVIRERREPNNPWALRGTTIHSVLSTYLNHLVQTRQPSDYATYDRLIEAIDGEAREILERLKESLVIDPEAVLGTEMYLTLDEELRPMDLEKAAWVGAAVEGTLDFLQSLHKTEIDIWDWKSYYQIIDPDTFQAHLYPFLAFQHFPTVETVRFHLKFVRYGATRSVEYRRERDLPRLRKMVLAARARQRQLHQDVLDDVDQYPTPGAQCTWCPLLQAGCPIAEQNPYAVMTAADRVAYGVWLESARKQNTTVLKDQVNAVGPIEHKDSNGRRFVAGFHQSVRSEYPLITTLEVITDWVKKTGEDITQQLLVGATKLNSLAKAKKRAPLLEELCKVRCAAPQTKFGIAGIDEDDEEG
jgi:hypothetical protein